MGGNEDGSGEDETLERLEICPVRKFDKVKASKGLSFAFIDCFLESYGEKRVPGEALGLLDEELEGKIAGGVVGGWTKVGYDSVVRMDD